MDWRRRSGLHLPALTKFLLVSQLSAAMGMIKDERRFVDRDNSNMSVPKVSTDRPVRSR